jgi:hypothetical protein
MASSGASVFATAANHDRQLKLLRLPQVTIIWRELFFAVSNGAGPSDAGSAGVDGH